MDFRRILRNGAYLVGVVVASLLAAPIVRAQVPADTAHHDVQFEERMQAQMAAFPTMMGNMMAVSMRAVLDELAKRETAQKMATFTKNYFDALVAQGFSREEALRIVSAHGVPLPASPR